MKISDNIKDKILRKNFERKLNKLQKNMKKQEEQIKVILNKLDEMDTPKGKEIIINK